MDDPGGLRAANRLFVAADLPPPARAALAATGAALADRMGGRAVPEANLHVTLDFLGRVPPEAAPEVAAAVREALAGPPAPVALAGLRGRPRASRARLVAVELEDRAGAWPSGHGGCAPPSTRSSGGPRRRPRRGSTSRC